MLRKMKQITIAIMIMGGLLAPLVAGTAIAAPVDDACAGLALAGGGNCDQAASELTFAQRIQQVINILSIIVGAVSVIMIIIGGFRYVISNGDSGALGSAKNTILYAIIGLVIVFFAQVIVRFVLTTVAK